MNRVITPLMRTLFAALCVAFVAACSAQTITYKQLTNYAALKTNGLHYGGLVITNNGTAIPSLTLGNADATSIAAQYWNIGVERWTVFVDSNRWQFTQFHPLQPGHLEFYKAQNSASIGFPGGVVTNAGDLRVVGIAYDQNGAPFASQRFASNAVQVSAGSGILVSPVGAGGVMTYTVTATGGAGATNAINIVSTNGAVGGVGLTSIAFNNGYGNTVTGVSNNSQFTLVWNVDFSPASNNTALAFGTLGTNVTNHVTGIGNSITNRITDLGNSVTSRINDVSTALTNALASKQDSYANLSALGNSGIQFPGTAALVSNVNQVLWNLMTEAVATNSATSNLTINVRTNKYYVTATNNITVTNFAGITAGVASDTTIIIEPQLIPRGITYPTLGGTSFGITANTNANSPMWTTLTNGVKYALTISSFGAQTFWSISAWK